MNAPQPSLAGWLFDQADLPLAQNLRERITAHGCSIDEVKELLIRELIYEGEPDVDWKTAAQTHIGFYDVTLADHTTLHQYWHFQRQEPLTYEQAAAELDLKRLIPSDRLFFEGDKPPMVDRHRLIFGFDPATGAEAIYLHAEGATLVEARWMCQVCGTSFRKQIDAEYLVWLADNPHEMKHVCAACHKRLTREKKIIREAK